MPTNEEGEFELVLGNKQLLSVFFIVVLLLGVFFAMGYIIGRNTSPVETQAASAKAPGSPMVVDAPGTVVEKPLAAESKPEPVASTPPVVSTLPPLPPTPEPAKPEPPAKAPAKSEPPATKTVAKSEPPKPAPKAAETKPAPAPPPPPPPVAARSGTLRPGIYLQVAATKRAEASLMAEVLTKKGFAATTQPVPDKDLIRVLVGPLDGAAVAKTKGDLEAAGFKSLQKKL